MNPFDPFRDNWHIGCVCEHLEALTKLQIKKLIINIPPRHLKSWLVSVFWFAWVWLRDPSSQWIFASYDEALAIRDSVRCRELVKHKQFVSWFKPQWMIKPDVDSKEIFQNTFNGTRKCTVFSQSTSATGFDAHYLVIDDPHSVNDKANKLQATNEMFGKTFTTRGNEPGDIRKAIICQRVDDEDLTGYLLAQRIGYEHLCLPLEYEPKRYYWSWEEADKAGEPYPIIPTTVQIKNPSLMDPRKEEGEVIHPERFTPDVLLEWKKGLKTDVPAQLQQAPIKETGRIFEKRNFRKYKMIYSNRLEEMAFVLDRGKGMKPYMCGYSECRFFQCADTAMTAKSTSSYVVNGTFAITPRGHLIVYHIWRHRLELPYQYPALIGLRRGPVVWHEERKLLQSVGEWPFTILFQAIENKSSGPGIVDMGISNGMPFKVLNPGKDDKVMRAAPLSTMYQEGSVYHPHEGDWVDPLETELIKFPKGSSDDQVDVMSYAAMLRSHDKILRLYLDEHMVKVTEGDYLRQREEQERQEAQAFTFKVGGKDINVRFDD